MSMSVNGSFVPRLRAAVDRAYVWSDLKWLVATAAGVWLGYEWLHSDAPALGNLMFAAAATAIGYIVRRAHRRRTFATHPLATALGKQGELEAVVQDLNHEFAGEPVTRPFHVGSRWLCYLRGTRIVIRRTDELIWAYTERVIHRVNYLIPYRVTYQLMIWDRAGTGTALPLRKRDARSALEQLGSVAPWMMFGYTEAAKETWNNDRADLIAAVDARRGRASHTTPTGEVGLRVARVSENFDPLGIQRLVRRLVRRG